MTFTRSRVKVIAGISFLIAAVLYLLGMQRVAVASISVLPLALFHSWLTRSAIMKGDSSSTVVARTLARSAISIAALVVGSSLGNDVMIGVLIGLSLEALTYLIDSVRLIIRR